jgi:hypothetical protein
MVKRKPDSPYGKTVKIITCANDLPEHTGKTGALQGTRPKGGLFRVYIGPGICQAIEVAFVDGEPAPALA